MDLGSGISAGWPGGPFYEDGRFAVGIAGGAPGGETAGFPALAPFMAAEFAGAYLQNRWARAEAQRNRDWQERMSSTAYQRSVQDMIRAGLNPMLLAGKASPASSGSGAQASYVNPFGGAASSAVAVRRNEEEVRNLVANRELLHAQRRKADAEARLSEYSSAGAKAEADFYTTDMGRVAKWLGLSGSSAQSMATVLGKMFGGKGK